MKYASLICLLLGLFLSPPAFSQFLSGNGLKEKLTKEAGTFDWGVGLGFLMGVSDTAQGVLFCLPSGSSGVTAGQLNEVVQKYFRQNPEQLHLAAEVLVTRAFKNNWPCQRKADSSGGNVVPPSQPATKPRPKPKDESSPF